MRGGGGKDVKNWCIANVRKYVYLSYAKWRFFLSRFNCIRISNPCFQFLEAVLSILQRFLVIVVNVVLASCGIFLCCLYDFCWFLFYLFLLVFCCFCSHCRFCCVTYFGSHTVVVALAFVIFVTVAVLLLFYTPLLLLFFLLITGSKRFSVSLACRKRQFKGVLSSLERACI